MYDPHTGEPLLDGPSPHRSPSARAGLEAPRYCPECGRRMVVRINPTDWVATCSRHGELRPAHRSDSAWEPAGGSAG